jgi:hypothetical protein
VTKHSRDLFHIPSIWKVASKDRQKCTFHEAVTGSGSAKVFQTDVSVYYCVKYYARSNKKHMIYWKCICDRRLGETDACNVICTELAIVKWQTYRCKVTTYWGIYRLPYNCECATVEWLWRRSGICELQASGEDAVLLYPNTGNVWTTDMIWRWLQRRLDIKQLWHRSWAATWRGLAERHDICWWQAESGQEHYVVLESDTT